KTGIVLLMMLIAALLVASCASKSAPTIKEKVGVEAPAIGESPVDAVADDISKVGIIDEGLDTSELDDVDSILEDIENI
ncbi:MAG: hypothetical protein AABX34_03245, partial [Nanoarchaeota archaeon]